eukprot:3435522-Rhodomonas_salina.1
MAVVNGQSSLPVVNGQSNMRLLALDAAGDPLYVSPPGSSLSPSLSLLHLSSCSLPPSLLSSLLPALALSLSLSSSFLSLLSSCAFLSLPPAVLTRYPPAEVGGVVVVLGDREGIEETEQ